MEWWKSERIKIIQRIEKCDDEKYFNFLPYIFGREDGKIESKVGRYIKYILWN